MPRIGAGRPPAPIAIILRAHRHRAIRSGREGMPVFRDDVIIGKPNMSDTPSSSSLIGRIGGLVMLALAIAYGIGGSQIEYAFASDPLGPRVVPVLLAITLAVLCLFYLKNPGTAEAFPRGQLLVKIVAVPLLLLASALLLEPAGFAASIFLLTFGVGWIFGAPLRLALIGGVGQAVLWWFVFSYLLDVYLPAGRLFG